jgi:F-type H+-transporting ATPase subunit epsilon
MATLVLHLQSATQYERVENVASFVAEDDSGSFGVLPGHARMMTVLTTGLARFRTAAGAWEYVAVPGAVLYCRDNELRLCTRRYLRDADYERIGTALRDQLVAEERALEHVKRRLRRLEEEMLKRIWMMRRHGDILA